MSDQQKDALVLQLDALNVPYEIFPCDPELADTQVFVKHYDFELEDCANTIIVKSKTGEQKYAACVVLATHRLDVNHTIRKKLSARKVSFAGAEETMRITGMTVGGVTPIGLPDGLPLWVDSAVMERLVIVLGGASRAWKISVTPKLFELLPNAEVVQGLAYPIAPPVG